MLFRSKNIIIFIFLCCCSLVLIFFIKSQQCLQKGGCFATTVNGGESAPWLLRRQSANGGVKDDKDGKCTKTILLYGMKPHWKVFCNLTEKSRYMSLIQLPKTFTCAESNCNVMLKYSEIAADIKHADIVAFTNTIRWMSNEMWSWAHGNRTEEQRWLFISRESPIYSPGVRPPDEYIATTYHWIASYKTDSEIYLPFGSYKPFLTPNKDDSHLREIILKKSKEIVWLSSKCQSLHWDMKGFVEDLESLIHVDKFGDCFKKPIPWQKEANLRQMFSSYRFSLSLEDSCCDDFITEIFWKSLDLGLVPIVVGASYSQYARIAPPSSFIHVDQFESMEEMAVYLTYLMEHDEKYIRFHKWRNLGSVVSYDTNEKYVEPLMMDTHCSILQTFLANNQSRENTIDYFGARWGRSCSFCGYKWIQSFGRKARH